jgi:Rrf2 family protein
VKLSTKGDYAVRALLELALEEPGTSVTVAELASRTAIPAKYLENLLGRLGAARVVRGRRGQGGGFTLARRADEITIAEVIREMEGPLAPSPCASKTAFAPCPAYRCPSEESCVLRGLWVEVRDAIAGVLEATTLADLARRTREVRAAAGGRYQI